MGSYCGIVFDVTVHFQVKKSVLSTQRLMVSLRKRRLITLLQNVPDEIAFKCCTHHARVYRIDRRSGRGTSVGDESDPSGSRRHTYILLVKHILLLFFPAQPRDGGLGTHTSPPVAGRKPTMLLDFVTKLDGTCALDATRCIITERI